MKKFYIIMIALILVSGASAQTDQPCSTCLPQGIDFSMQNQIDSFQINYPNCTHIAGNVDIGGDGIYNLNGLSSLDSISGWLFIWYTDSLSDLTGLNGLKTVSGGIAIEDNHGLNSLAGLNGLTSTYFLSIRSNTLNNNLFGLDSLNFIEASLTIDGNGLSSLSGLNNLDSIGGDFFILEPEIIDFNGLDELVCIGGDFTILLNSALTSLAGLENLTSIRGDLSIGLNPGFMAGNPVLTSLTGLENLTSIGGTLSILGNDALTSLTGLDNINGGSLSGLTIVGNGSLSECEVQSICDYLATPNAVVEIHNNAPGCNSQEEVEESCSLGLDESAVSSRQSAVNIFPNPASNQITISRPATPQKTTSLTIYNINGQQLMQRQITVQQTVVDMSGLSQGVYFVKITDDSNVLVGKIIRQ